MTGEDGAATPPPDDRRDKVERAKRTVAAIARILEDRDAIVDDALTRLESAGVIDAKTRARTWDKYARGDAHTRRYMSDLVARVVGGERRSGPIDAEEVKASPASREALESLKEVSSGKMPPPPPANGGTRPAEEENALLRMVSGFPLLVLKVKRSLIFAGLALLILVGVAAVFPDHARLVLFYGFLVILGIFGLFLIKWAFQMDRALKRQGIDVKGLSRLEPSERRILLVRRFLRHTFSSERVGAFVARRMRNGRETRRKQRKTVEKDA